MRAENADQRFVKIRINQLTKVFETRERQVTALDRVSFKVPDGLVLGIVGPSGCGKTTLLRIVAGLEEKTSGEVKIAQQNQQQPLTNMIFQQESILPWYTVRQNIAYGLKIRGENQEKVNRVVDQYMAMVGLSAFADSYPHQLSGGMKQRVSIARAFANDPEILLMDEPFASLDAQNKLLLQQELLEIWQGSGKTMLYVTHSIDDALNVSDRVMVMTAQPGKVKAEVNVDLPRLKDLNELKNHAHYGPLYQKIWALLREEVVEHTSA